jgi:glycosyltransferase 2 family protein
MKSLINLLRRHAPFLKKTVPIFFYLLIAAFVVLYIKSIDFHALASVNIQWLLLIVAILVGLLARYWNAFIWLILLHTLGAKSLRQHLAELLHVYSKSWMGRYIPGTAPWILGKIYFASKVGIPKNKLAISSLLEAALQVLVFIALSLVLLLADNRLEEFRNQYILLLSIAIIGCIVAILPPVFNAVISFAYKLLKRKNLPKEDLASSKTIFRGVALFVVSSLINGVSLFLVAKSIDASVGTDDLLYIMGAGNLAAAIGMLAVFAPSGVGVREGIQLLLLSIIINPAYALIVVIMSRVVEVIGDIIFFICGWAAHRFSKTRSLDQ